MRGPAGCIVLSGLRDVSGTAQFRGAPTFSRDWIAGVPHRWHNWEKLDWTHPLEDEFSGTTGSNPAPTLLPADPQQTSSK